MDKPAQEDKEVVRGKAQWRMGIAALRKARSLVDGYEKDEQFKKAAGRKITIGFVAILVLVLIGLVVSPGTIQSLFRSLS